MDKRIDFTGESSAQAASFDWKKKAALSAFADASLSASQKEQLDYTGGSSAQVTSFEWKRKAAFAAFAGALLAASQTGCALTRAALDQSSRYAELSLDEDA